MSEEKSILEMLMAGMPVRVINNVSPRHHVLAPAERELADALVKIAERYGKFNEDGNGIWAGYDEASSNTVARIGVKCENCSLYMGAGQCKIILKTVEPEGKCRFAILPDGVVRMAKGGPSDQL